MEFSIAQVLLDCVLIISFCCHLAAFGEAVLQKTSWMTYLGCYGGHPTSIDSYQTHVITMNHPGACSRQCRNWEYFALQNTTCTCFNGRSFNELSYITYNRCQLKCPDFSHKMYCGWHDMRSVYRRETGLFFHNNFNCLTVVRHQLENEIISVSCQKKQYFICEYPRGKFIMKDDKHDFNTAKLYCENGEGRLIIINESLPTDMEENTAYWIGTFRQNTKRSTASPIVQSTMSTFNEVLIGISTKPNSPQTSKREAEAAITTIFSPNLETTIERKTTLADNFTLDISTDNNRKNVEFEKTTNQRFKAKHSSDDNGKQNNSCGIFCFSLGIALACVATLAIIACMYQLRQQWDMRFKRSVQEHSEISKDQTSNNEESKPVYLDPVKNVAVFHKRNLSKINHHIYDKSEVYSTTESVPKQPVLSDYQDLHFKDSAKSKPKYTEPWDAIDASEIPEADTGPKCRRKSFPFNFRSLRIPRKKKAARQDPYEETVIDVKKFIYDQPSQQGHNKRISEAWKNYKYHPSLNVKSKGMAPGRGLSVAQKAKMFDEDKNLRNPPDIIIHNIPSEGDSDNRIYATPDNPIAENERETRKVKSRSTLESRGKMLKSQLSKIKKTIRNKRRPITVDADSEYAVPNTARHSEWFLENADDEKIITPQHQLMRHSYHASKLGSDEKGKIQVDSKSSKNINIKTKNRFQSQEIYDLAKPICDKTTETNKQSEAIYFEPVL